MKYNDLNIVARDERVRDYVLPCRTVLCGGDIVNADGLLRNKPLQITTREDDYASFSSGSFIVLDFGRELSGGVRILTFRGNGKIRLRFGESVSETCSDLKGTSNGATATNDHAGRDFFIDLGFMSDQRYGDTGFRFLRIDFFCDTDISSIVAVFDHLDLKRCGSFYCSDDKLNQIFDTAAYTVELCMQTMLWDGIKRDRLVWIGDMHPETLAIHSLFGYHPLVEKALEFEKKRRPLPDFMNGKATYSLWWLCIFADEYMQNGNQTFFNENIGYVKDFIALLDSFVTPDGILAFSSERNDFFIDWPTFAHQERKAGTQALCAYALKKVRQFLSGNDVVVIDNILSRLKTNLDGGGFKQVIALKSLAGHISKEVAGKQLANGGSKGLSTFMSYHILSALSDGGQSDDALNILREYYSGMLSCGATTFWEDFDIEWLNCGSRIDELPKDGQKDIHGDFGAHCYTGFRHSLCHGWSAGAVPYLMNYVLGIRPLSPACTTVSIKPNLSNLDFAEGTYPTPHGNIKISHRRKNNKIITDFDIPKGINPIF